MQTLVGMGANVNKLVKGKSYIRMAAMSGLTVAVEALLEHGADPNLQNKDGHSALRASSGEGRCPGFAARATHAAAARPVQSAWVERGCGAAGHTEIVKALLKAGADPNHKRHTGGGEDKKTADGLTAMHRAAAMGHGEILQARPTHPYSSGQAVSARPAARAVIDRRCGRRQALLEAGGEVNPEIVEHKTTPLMAAASQGHVKPIQALIKKKADLNIQDGDDQNTALHTAAQGGFLECAQVLMEAGADMGVKNKHELTPLNLATAAGQGEVAKLMMEWVGVDPNAKNAEGATGLHNAALAGNVEVTKVLIQAGADPDMTDNDGATALHVAAFAGKVEVVLALIAGGADMSVQDTDGETPLQIAEAENQAQVVEVRPAPTPRGGCAATRGCVDGWVFDRSSRRRLRRKRTVPARKRVAPAKTMTTSSR